MSDYPNVPDALREKHRDNPEELQKWKATYKRLDERRARADAERLPLFHQMQEEMDKNG